MTVGNMIDRSLDQKHSRSALLVLGMHRSGTSAITGALGLCGAWVGDETELTRPNAENPRGFWERVDMRQICDRLLHSAGADWWKVSSFDPKAIPHAILVEQRQRFAKIISMLAEHETWVLKEPRLSLLLPVLRDHISDPVCIHIIRNPLEVARSLQIRNGFPIAAGLALWEAYNRYALNSSENMPRIIVSHQSLMLHPVDTLNELLTRLDDFAVRNLTSPTDNRLEQFINPSFYRRRATDEETAEYLTPSQHIVWEQFRNGQLFDQGGNISLSRVTTQQLFDLELTERSLSYHKEQADKLRLDLRKLAATIRTQIESLNTEKI